MSNPNDDFDFELIPSDPQPTPPPVPNQKPPLEDYSELPLPELVTKIGPICERMADLLEERTDVDVDDDELWQHTRVQAEKFVEALERFGEPAIPAILETFTSEEFWKRARNGSGKFLEQLHDFPEKYQHVFVQHYQSILNILKIGQPQAEVYALSLLFWLSEEHTEITNGLIAVLETKELVDSRTDLLELLEPLSITNELYSRFVAWTQPCFLRQFKQSEPDDAIRFLRLVQMLGSLASKLIGHENQTGETKPELGLILDLLATGAGHTHPDIAVPCATTLERLEAISPETMKKFVQNSTLETCRRLLNENPQRDQKWLHNWLDLYSENDLPEHGRIAILESISATDTDETNPILKIYSQVLTGHNTALKLAVIEGLKLFRSLGAEIVDILQLLLKSSEKVVREKFAKTIPEIQIDKKIAFRVVKTLLGDPEEEVRSEAGSAAISLDIIEKLAEVFTEETRDENHDVRARAYLGLGCLFFDDTEEQLKTVLRGLKDENVRVRRAAAEGVYEASDGDYEPTIRFLKRALEDEDVTVRFFAIRSLGLHEGDAYDLIDTLLEMRDDLSPQIRGAVHGTLAQIAGNEKKIQRSVLKAMRDRNETVVLLTLKGIDLDDFDSPEVQETVAQLVSHSNESIRRAAFYCLAEYDVEEYQPETWKAFRVALLDPNPDLREAAFDKIAEQEDQAAYIVKELVQLLQNPGSIDVDTLTDGIAMQTQAYVPLLDIFSHPKLSVRQAVFQALQKLVQMKPTVAHPVAEALMLEFPDAVASHRGKSLELLLSLIGTLGPAVSYLYPEVSRLLNHPCAQVRADACWVLGTFGEISKPLLPKFTAFYNSNLLLERAGGASALLLLDTQDTDHQQQYINTMYYRNPLNNLYLTRAIMVHPRPTTPMIKACYEYFPWVQMYDSPKGLELAADFYVFGDKLRPFLPIILDAYQYCADPVIVEKMLKSFLRVAPMLLPYFEQYLATLDEISFIDEPELYIKVLVAIKHPDLVTALGKLLYHRFGIIRVAVAEELLKMGMAAKPILPTILEAIRDPNWDNWETTKSELYPWLEDAIPDPDMDRSLSGHDERDILIELIERMGPSAHKAIPTLQKVLDEEYENVRHAAIEALIAIGPSARNVLEDATDHEDDYVADRASAALEELYEEDDDEDEDDRPRRRQRDDY